MSFLDILLEAKGDKKPAAKPTKINVKNDNDTDYTADTPAPEDDDTTPAPDSTPEDSDTPDTGTDDGGDDTDSTDYTEQTDELSVDDDDSGDDTPTDGDDSPDDSSDSTSNTNTDTDDSVDGEQDDKGNENELKRILLEDFINLHALVKNTINKLSNIDKSNIVINKIVGQITTNLNKLKKQLFDFITFTFSTKSYASNLYKYNYFVEALKINVEMLKKISIFIPN